MQFTSLISTALAFFAIANALPVDPTLEAREADPNFISAIAKIATKCCGRDYSWKGPDLSKVMLGAKTKERLRLNGPSRV
ncbi:hypothetical protein CKM354_000421300 [Cercospora kikuchii]|uniref:Uncharacterized protein n=1 Tax=Cercospora kikuchii TaxID=84275 RepID=A0A9P3FEF1_9PEZI|nr:uncharacterized protein CKM354_000421300 [Cercospora kikuchii]GIZ40892.1 hypothetical protein CKM354_000421300 [Cercospora kikuchii]